MGRADCIRIIRYDPVREADNVKRMKSRAKESISKQTGFRWVFEALARGGDIHDVDPFQCTSYCHAASLLIQDNRS